jgi:hypothetical protein
MKKKLTLLLTALLMATSWAAARPDGQADLYFVSFDIPDKIDKDETTDLKVTAVVGNKGEATATNVKAQLILNQQTVVDTESAYQTDNLDIAPGEQKTFVLHYDISRYAYNTHINIEINLPYTEDADLSNNKAKGYPGQDVWIIGKGYDAAITSFTVPATLLLNATTKQLEATVTVGNLGGKAISNAKVTLYGNGQELDNSDNHDDIDLSTIAEDGSKTVTLTYGGVKAGDVLTDVYAKVTIAETDVDLSNNESQHVDKVVVLNEGIDVAVTGATFPEELTPGEPGTASVTLKNIGSEGAGSFCVRVYDKANPETVFGQTCLEADAAGASGSPLPSNTERTVTIALNAEGIAAGLYDIVAFADVTDDVDLSNNYSADGSSLTVNVTGDLSMGDIDVADELDLAVNPDLCIGNVIINNNGKTDVKNATAELYIDGQKVWTSQPFDVEAEGEAEVAVACYSGLTPGDHKVNVHVSAEGDPDDTNNWAFGETSADGETIRVSDSSTADASISAEIPEVIDLADTPELCLTATVKNDGSLASDPVNVEYYIDGRKVADIGFSLDAHSTILLTLPCVTVGEGEHKVNLHVTAANDGDDSDNWLEGSTAAEGKTITVTDSSEPAGNTDLGIIAYTLPETVDLDQQNYFEMKVTVKNWGEETAVNVNVDLIVNGAIVDRSQNYYGGPYTLAPGAERTFTLWANNLKIQHLSVNAHVTADNNTDIGNDWAEDDNLNVTAAHASAPSTVSVAIGTAGWTSFYELNHKKYQRELFAPAAGVTAYVVSELSADKAVLTPVEHVTEGGAVLLSGAAGGYEFDILDGNYYSQAWDAAYKAERRTTSNLLKVSDGSVKGGANIWVLANGANGVGFYNLAEGEKVPEGKVYVKKALSASSRFIALDGDATGIGVVAATAADGTPVYNLSGQRVSGSFKGIVILNGKKVCNK